MHFEMIQFSKDFLPIYGVTNIRLMSLSLLQDKGHTPRKIITLLHSSTFVLSVVRASLIYLTFSLLIHINRLESTSDISSFLLLWEHNA